MSSRVTVLHHGSNGGTITRQLAVYSIPLRGINVVRSLAKTSTERLYVVHVGSGKTLISKPINVHELTTVIQLMLPLNWSLSEEEICSSPEHRSIILLAEKIITRSRGASGVRKPVQRITSRQLATLREQALARNLGAEVVRGSGSNPYNPRDLKTDTLLVELKQLRPETMDSSEDPYHTLDGRDMKLLTEQGAERRKSVVYVWEFGDIRVAGIPRDTLDEEATPLFAETYKSVASTKNSWRLRLSEVRELERVVFASVNREDLGVGMGFDGPGDSRQLRMPGKIIFLTLCEIEWVLVPHWYFLRVIKGAMHV